jgi:hypothetical protein
MAVYGDMIDHCTINIQSAKENVKGVILRFVYGRIEEYVRRGEEPGGVSGQMRLIQPGSIGQEVKIFIRRIR